MDPVTILGAVGSVVGIASFGLQLAKFLDEFLDEFQSADENLNAIFNGVVATNNALSQVEGLLREERKNIVERGKPILFSEKALNDVQDNADQCLQIFWRIEATVLRKDSTEAQILRRLDRFHKELRNTRDLDEIPSVLKFDNTQKLSRRQQLTWAFSTGDKLEKYNRQLYRLQTTLILVFQVVHLRYNLTKPKQRLDDMLDLPQSYKKIKIMAAELGMIDGEKSRRHEGSTFNPFEPRRGDSQSETLAKANGRHRTLSRKRDTLDSLNSEPRGTRRRDSRFDDMMERAQNPRQTYEEPKFENRKHQNNLNRSRATRQDSELSATPETKLVARHLQKAQSYMATHNEGQTELPLGTGPKTANNGFGDFPFSVSPTPMEQDETSMLPEHGSTPSPKPEAQKPSRSNVEKPKKPTVYQRPSVTDQTLVTEDSDIRQKVRPRAADVQFNLDPTNSQHHKPQGKGNPVTPRPILRRSRPSLDRSQRQDTFETISPPSPLSEENLSDSHQDNWISSEYSEGYAMNQAKQEPGTNIRGNRKRPPLQRGHIDRPSNTSSEASDLLDQTMKKAERDARKTQQYPLRQSKKTQEILSRQAINSVNGKPPPTIRLNSEKEEMARASPENPANFQENSKEERPPASKSVTPKSPPHSQAGQSSSNDEDDNPNIFHVVHPTDRIVGSDSKQIPSIRPTSQVVYHNEMSNDWQTISHIETNSNASNTTSASKRRATVYNALKRITRQDFMSQDDLENMFGTGALVTAFVVRGQEYHQIPCAGHFSLRKADMANLRSSGSISWKDFAFLDPEEISTLSQILQSGDDYAKALVQLKWLRKERGMKFWSSGDRALIAIVYNEKVGSENGSISQQDRRNSVASTERSFAFGSNSKPLLPSNLKWASTANQTQAVTEDTKEADPAAKTSHNYVAYTIRVFDPRNTYGDSKLVPPTLTREGFSEEDILRRILELNVKGPRAIKKKHSLILSQQEQILQAVTEMMAQETDSRYSWHVAQLEKLDDSSSGLRSVTVYLRRTMKGAISSIALSKRDPWGVDLEDKNIRSRVSSPRGHDDKPRSRERISRADLETQRNRREWLEDERELDEYVLRRPAATVDTRYHDEDFGYGYRPEWRDRRETEYNHGYPRRYRSPEPRYEVPAAPIIPVRHRSVSHRRPPSPSTGTRHTQNHSSTYENEPEIRRRQSLYQPNAPPRAPTTVMGGPPPPPVIINNRIYNNDDDEDQYYLTAPPPHRRSSVSHRAASRISRPSDHHSRSASMPRRASIPYPEYYDSRSFNPRPGEGDNLYEDTDVVKNLYLEWTPAGEEAENQDNNNSRSASTEDSERSRGKGRETNKRHSQTYSKVGRSDTEIMNGVDPEKDISNSHFATRSQNTDRRPMEKGNSEPVEDTRGENRRPGNGVRSISGVRSLSSDSVVSVNTLNQDENLDLYD